MLLCHRVRHQRFRPGRRVQGIDPNNAARNVGIVYDIGAGSAFEVGALPGFNGALAFGVGNGGHVVGSSMLNQGSGLPFIWSDAGGIVPIPLAAGTSQGSARAVNSAGWVVGQDSSAFSIPFLYDGTTTYRLADLIPAGTGWDLSTNTSSSALGISDNDIIVGTGVYNGAVTRMRWSRCFNCLSCFAQDTWRSRHFRYRMPLTGTCRRGVPGRWNYTLIITFSNAIVSGGAGVTGGTGTVWAHQPSAETP